MSFAPKSFCHFRRAHICLIALGILLLNLSCTKHEDTTAVHEETIQSVGETDEDFKIPITLWTAIEGKSVEPSATAPAKSGHGSGEPAKAEGEAESEEKRSFIFAPLRVTLIEKNEDILTKPRMQIDYPRGGGVLDLSQVVTGNEGSFYFKIEIPEISGLQNVRTFYVSHARKRKIDGEIFGAGCNVYMDISQKFNHEMSGDGLKVNTVRQRHVSVLAGHIILAANHENQVMVAQLHIIDSKNSNLTCGAAHERKSSNSGQ